MTDYKKISEKGQDLTHGNIFKELWSLAWPMMLSFFFYTLYNLVDAYWVSKISADAISAVSISQIALFIMISLGFGITVGSGVIMAMHIGAKDIKGAERVLGQSFVLSAVAGMFFTIIAFTFKTQLLTASGANGDIFEPALHYFTITSGGSILFFILITIMFAFNAQGDTFTLTKLFALSTLVNLIMDPLLIFGRFGLPELGISGAAVATLISQAVFIIIALHSLSSERRNVSFSFKNLSLQWQSVKKVLNIGIPAALTQVMMPIGVAAMSYITFLGFAEDGTNAFNLGYRMEMFAFLPAVGFGVGAMAMMSQSIGAGNKRRAAMIFGKALKYAFMASLSIGLLVFLFSRPILGIFTDDPLVTKYAMGYMWSVTLTYGFLAALMVESSAFQAIGKSWPGFWISFLRFVIISIPMAYILTQVFSFAIWGIWISLMAGNLIAALVGYFWIHSKLKKLEIKEVPVHA